MNLINKILLESDNLFLPRKIEEREEEWNKEILELYKKYNVEKTFKDIYIGVVFVISPTYYIRKYKYLFRDKNKLLDSLKRRSDRFTQRTELKKIIPLLQNKESTLEFLIELEKGDISAKDFYEEKNIYTYVLNVDIED